MTRDEAEKIIARDSRYETTLGSYNQQAISAVHSLMRTAHALAVYHLGTECRDEAVVGILAIIMDEARSVRERAKRKKRGK